MAVHDSPDIQPNEPEVDDPSTEVVDEAISESFPASDPPAWTGGTGEDVAADVIPDFRFPASTGQTLDRDAFLGKVRMVAVVIAQDTEDGAAPILRALHDSFGEFGKRSAQLLVFMPTTARSVRSISENLGIRFPVLADPTGKFARASGAASGSGSTVDSALVADRDGTVFARMRGLGNDFVQSLLDAVDGIPD